MASPISCSHVEVVRDAARSAVVGRDVLARFRSVLGHIVDGARGVLGAVYVVFGKRQTSLDLERIRRRLIAKALAGSQ
jgi:hypothetical protein